MKLLTRPADAADWILYATPPLTEPTDSPSLLLADDDLAVVVDANGTVSRVEDADLPLDTLALPATVVFVRKGECGWIPLRQSRFLVTDPCLDEPVRVHAVGRFSIESTDPIAFVRRAVGTDGAFLARTVAEAISRACAAWLQRSGKSVLELARPSAASPLASMAVDDANQGLASAGVRVVELDGFRIELAREDALLLRERADEIAQVRRTADRESPASTTCRACGRSSEPSNFCAACGASLALAPIPLPKGTEVRVEDGAGRWCGFIVGWDGSSLEVATDSGRRRRRVDPSHVSALATDPFEAGAEQDDPDSDEPTHGKRYAPNTPVTVRMAGGLERPATVINSLGARYKIAFDDAAERAWIDAAAVIGIRDGAPVETARRDSSVDGLPVVSAASAGPVKPGSEVFAQAEDGRWYPATVRESRGDSVRIEWIDGIGGVDYVSRERLRQRSASAA